MRRRTMRFRRPVALLAVLGSVGLLTVGCGDEPRAFGTAHVESDAPHPRATDEEVASGAEIVNHVAAELYGPIADEAKDGNLAYSPVSIATALAMARAGAQGTSAEQFDAFFGSDDPATLGRSVNGATAGLQDLTGPVPIAGEDELGEIELTNANALWGQSGVEFQEPFLDDLRTQFDASMWTADFAADPEQARAGINDWVAEHTREHIPELLPQDSINPRTRLVLTNAVFFKAPWPAELDDAGSMPFTTASGDEVQADMVGDTSTYPFQRGDGWVAVTIPYAGGKLGMTLLVPDEGKLTDVEAAIDDELLHQVLTGGEDHPVMLRFPKIDLASTVPLGDALRGLGVTEPFETETDFEPITTDPDAQPLHIDDVLHQATVTVDEHGTEASAATAVVFETVGGMITEEELIVDRPYLFAIHDLEHGIPLFLGRVTDPTKE